MTQDALVGESYPTRDRASSARGAAVATVAAYAGLGLILVATRLLALGNSFWHDEIYTVARIIRPGPGRIFTGPELNHQLFSLLAWAGQYVLGYSEIAYRLWSAVPFVLGVAVVTAWLHVRVRALAGILFLFLATVSPLLLDITREARGYGLAFSLMAAMMVAALETDRRPRTWSASVFCAAGVLGSWTLPQFGIAFVATGIALLSNRQLTRRLAIGLVLSLIAIGVWYAPHVSELTTVSQDSGRVQIHSVWLITAPIDQIVIPAFVWIDGVALIPGPIWVPIVFAVVTFMASSPLVRDRRVLLLLLTGTVATVVVLWIGQTYVVPRYLSYLLVPLLMLLASGMARVLADLGKSPMFVRTIVSFVVLAVLAIRFVTLAPDVVRLPREAHRDAAAIVESRDPKTPVLAYLHNPRDLAFYLGRPVRALEPSDVVSSVCDSRVAVAYVMQPFAIQPVDVPCLNRAGTTHYRFRQYTRGEMNVWFVPPEP